MSEHLDEQLIDGLAPPDAPTDDEVRGYLAALGDTDPERAEKARPPFEVHDLGSADWAGRKVRQAHNRIGEAQRWRDRVVAEADAHLEREKARHLPTIEFFEEHLTRWLRAEIDADPKGAKSRDLPCGLTVKRTKGRTSLVVEDEAALVEWLRDEHPTLVEFVPRFSKAAVKRLTTTDGLALKGATVETGEDTYTVVGGDA